MLISLLQIAACISTSPTILNGDYQKTADSAWTMYISAQKEYQHGLAELIAGKNPTYREIAVIARDLQLEYIESRTMEFQYLLHHDPDRIILTNGISRFANYDWSPADSIKLSKKSSKYRHAQKRLAELKVKNESYSNWPAYRTWIHDILSKDQDYIGLMNSFNSRLKEAESILGQAR